MLQGIQDFMYYCVQAFGCSGLGDPPGKEASQAEHHRARHSHTSSLWPRTAVRSQDPVLGVGGLVDVKHLCTTAILFLIGRRLSGIRAFGFQGIRAFGL